MFSALAKPAYLYRPQQLVQRVRLGGQAHPLVVLPWGSKLQVTATESIGSGIARAGVHELPVTEAMFRLLAAGDFAVDAGANIGYFTSLMAFRVGPGGAVLALEPHPILRDALEKNVVRWNVGHVTVDPRAVSDRSGSAHLEISDEFSTNMGTASLGKGSSSSIAVQTVSLDQVLAGRSVALLKLDVEGHELSALDGAKAALRARRIRHILFEEHATLPTPVSVRLEEAGFTLFALHERLRGVEPLSPLDPSARPRWDAPTYLATLVPEMVLRRLRPNGWWSLRPRGPLITDKVVPSTA